MVVKQVPCRIVSANSSQLEAYHDLLRKADIPFVPPETPLPTLVAVDAEGKVVGGIQVREVLLRPDEAEFSHLVVSKAAMGNKVGTALYEAAVKAAKGRGCTSASTIAADPASIEFAEKFGFSFPSNLDAHTMKMSKRI